MKNSLLCMLMLGVALLLLPPRLLAHHGDAGRYNEDVITVAGTVVELVMVNPHAQIIFDVAKDGKTTRWTAELGGPQQLIKQFGWTANTAKPGSKITLTGRQVKSGAPYINLTERANIVLTDSGKEIYRTPNYGEPPPAATAQAN